MIEPKGKDRHPYCLRVIKLQVTSGQIDMGKGEQIMARWFSIKPAITLKGRKF